MRTRLNAISGEPVLLNTTFYQAGQPKDPYAIRAVKIYKNSVRPENLVLTIPILGGPGDCGTAASPTEAAEYPSPIQRVPISGGTGACGTVLNTGNCGTVPGETQYVPGAYTLAVDLPACLFDTGMYFDVWCFIGSESDIDPASCATTDVTADDSFDCTTTCDTDCLQSFCNKFFVTAGGWYGDDDLTTLRLGFEPLDTRFQQPEKRKLEVGMMPLPLYDFDYKKIMPLLPFLQGTITIESQHHELLVTDAPMTIGERTGSYRSNPFVLRYLIDTTKFLKGTYQYRVDVQLPNGESRSSPYFNITIA